MKEVGLSGEGVGAGRSWMGAMNEFFDSRGIAPEDPRRISALNTMQEIADAASIREFLPVVGVKVARDLLRNG